MYKGELCGLCSEFDGEKIREFRGMDRCLYREVSDFIDSAMVKRQGMCKVKRVEPHNKICDDESKWRIREDISTPEETRKLHDYLVCDVNL